MTMDDIRPTLVIGATGKVGSRVAGLLAEQGVPVRTASRSSSPAFDWEDRSTWGPVLDGVGAVHLSYHSDLAFPGAPETVRAFIEAGLDRGVERFVLLATRGADEVERVAMAVPDGAPVTVLHCAWFMQNFSEGFLFDTIGAGGLVAPGGAALEPWVDVDDIAAVSVAALTGDGHAGRAYDLTSPQALTLTDVADTLAAATGRPFHYTEVDAATYADRAAADGVPAEYVEFMTFLFAEVLGTNPMVTDDVASVLGRPARTFAQFASAATASGAWEVAAAS